MKALEAAAWLIFLVIVGAVIGGGYAALRVVESTVAAIPAVGWLAAGGAALFAFVLVIVGGAVYIVKALAARSRRIYARDGLYPVVDHGNGRYANLNEPGAQSLAVLAAGRRPTAALAGRVIDAQWRNGNPSENSPDLPQLPEPAARFPARVDVYGQPLPRALALPVGVDGDGQPVNLALRNLGNVLVGGLPRSGKSELLASMAAGLLRQDASGRTVQIACVDTKLVSFGLLDPNLAALYAPPALSVEAAHDLVASLANEVQRRFELLHAARVRSLEELESTSGERLPYLLLLMDELADMTKDRDTARRDRFLNFAEEIGRKGAAAGVTLIMATQRPSADVIPSSLRNLAGAQIAFRVSRNHDAIAIMGEPGAELLPAVPGRCLVKHSGVVQVQALMAGLEGGQFDRFCAAQPLAQLQRLDGIPVDNWPTTAPTTAVVPVVGGCERLEPGREPDATTAQQLRRLHADGWSKTRLCLETWGYKDGVVWSYLDRALAGEL